MFEFGLLLTAAGLFMSAKALKAWRANGRKKSYD